MAKVYGLSQADRDKLQRTVRAEDARTKNPTDPASTGSAPVLFAPCIVRITSTIAARSGTTPGSADCEMWLISDGTLEQNAAENTKTVYNLGTAAVVGTTADPIYGVAIQVRGGAFVLLHTWSLCEALEHLSSYDDTKTQYLRHVSGACASWNDTTTC